MVSHRENERRGMGIRPSVTKAGDLSRGLERYLEKKRLRKKGKWGGARGEGGGGWME